MCPHEKKKLECHNTSVDPQLANSPPRRPRTKQVYSSDFYSSRDAATGHAAKAILGIVMGVVPARSVCDVGCGTGTWIRVAKELGAVEVLGIEGAWVEDKHLVVEPDNIRRQNLEQPINSEGRFHLAICLEVAEHLSPIRGPGLVADLCRLSDAVLFSAAIPA
jgi:2-polyprenyl-3-methyl-5-hydroxy-6-metoxy-1,4-benzoquinol methylase